MIKYFEDEKTFMLSTNVSTYAFKINDEGYPVHLFYGAKTEHICDLPTMDELKKTTTLSNLEEADAREYPEWGGEFMPEPSIMARFKNGVRDLILKFSSYKTEEKNDAQILYLKLYDDYVKLSVTLKYKVYDNLDIIERNCIIKNESEDKCFLDRAFSASVFLPYQDNYRLTTLCGAWAGEYQITEQVLNRSEVVLQSRTGLSGPEFAPFFMLDENSFANEKSGNVYFGTLIWSGNWKFIFEKDSSNRTIVSGGISDFDFSWCLDVGEEFETPVFLFGYTENGFGDVSKKLHTYQREYIMHPNEKNRIMPLVYNAYGTFMSQISEEKITSVIKKAASLGVELFVMDSGWTGFGDDKEYNYRQGFGDWVVNKDRFPNGLKPIADKIHQNGMKFGIWLEPEAVNPKSNLFKEHPDWVHNFNGREPIERGFRYVLNFANEDAAKYMTDKVLNFIKEYDIDCFKMDFCRFNVMMADRNLDFDHQKEVWVRHVKNLYKFYETIKKEYPDIIIENCASGGFRADLGMLKFSGRMNRSDNQDPLDILKIHEGFSMFLLPKLAGGGCHISDMFTQHINSRTSAMKFQAHVGMMGSLAIGKNLNEITLEEEEELKEYVKLYKEIRETIQLGDVYRIASPRKKPYAVFEYVSKDKQKAVVCAYSQSMQFAKMPERIKLDGLLKDALYNVEGYGIKSGKGLMDIGIQIPLRGDMDSKIIKIEKV